MRRRLYLAFLAIILNCIVAVGVLLTLDFFPYSFVVLFLGAVGNVVYFMNREKIVEELERLEMEE